jgi:hypothetical protein
MDVGFAVAIVVVPLLLGLAERSWNNSRKARKASVVTVHGVGVLRPIWKRNIQPSMGVGDACFAIDHHGQVRAQVHKYWDVPGPSGVNGEIWGVHYVGDHERERSYMNATTRMASRELAEKWVEDNWLGILEPKEAKGKDLR